MKVLLICALLLATSCVKEIDDEEEVPVTIELPTVTTKPLSDTTQTSVKTGGEVSDDGGADVTERGVVYATTAKPTTADTKISSGSGLGAFEMEIAQLEMETEYHVRAYATNEKGTAYGEDLVFTTRGEEAPDTVVVENCEVLSMAPFIDYFFSEENWLKVDNEIAEYTKMLGEALRVSNLEFIYTATNNFEITDLTFEYEPGDNERPVSVEGVVKRYHVREFDENSTVSGGMIYDLVEEVPFGTAQLTFNDSGFISKMDYGSRSINFIYEGGKLVSIDNGNADHYFEYNVDGDVAELYGSATGGMRLAEPSVTFAYSNEEVPTADYRPFAVSDPIQTEYPDFGTLKWLNPDNYPVVLAQLMNWVPLRPRHLRTRMSWNGLRSETASHYYINQTVDEKGRLFSYDVAAVESGEMIGQMMMNWYCKDETIIIPGDNN